jgi:KUP system potassium uptake protein
MGPGVWRMAVQFGFMNSLDIVPVLELAAEKGLRFELMETTFFLSRQKVVPVEGGEGMAFWRDKLFAVLARNAADMTDFLSIPANRVIELGTFVEL